ncbi:MAG: hypothetical protein AAGF36_02520 [Pseudomonadota bacterium]
MGPDPEQENCDSGTAARVFLVEGVGHWIWPSFGNKARVLNEAHLCNIALRNWNNYKSGELEHGYDVPDQVLEMVADRGHEGRLLGAPSKEIFACKGKREAVPEYSLEDDKIVVALGFWLKSKGLKIET